ncbi:hypothetical protein MtrunA17_Chr6g0474191 [Medicago truncatula]|uniref:Uncharacterized protein n=1 Tax=Medicago truncatula TaxID=3880 RepID=A0A396HEX8_MEDTR|nr:hypothetical protein MtrunA17_Chr6g0474191 [Medicago truncatula]
MFSLDICLIFPCHIFAKFKETNGRADVYVKKDTLVNFLIDPQEGISTLCPANVSVYKDRRKTCMYGLEGVEGGLLTCGIGDWDFCCGICSL